MQLKDWLMFMASMVLIVLQVWLDLLVPGFMSIITRLVQTVGSPIEQIWLNGAYMLLCALGSFMTAISIGFFAARIGASFSRHLRSEIFSKVASFSMEEINHFSTASLITRSTNDVTQIQMLIIMSLQLVIKAPIMAIWAINKISGKSGYWSFIVVVCIIFMLIILVIMVILVMPKFRKMQTLTDNITRVTRENLSGLRVVRAYNAEEYQKGKFETTNKDLTNTQLFTSRSMAVLMPIMQTMMSGLTLAIYWMGAYIIEAASLSDKLIIFSDMVVFSSYAIQVIMSFMMLAMMFVMLPRASVSIKRVNELLQTQPKIIDGEVFEGNTENKGEIEFKKVSFKYPDSSEEVLSNISFKVKKGETIAFIGATGSGKSTLLNLIPRFYDVSKGEVLVEGVNVKNYKLESLLNLIGYIPQKAVLFQGTVESNVAYGNNGIDEYNSNDVIRAIRIAQGSDFVEEMEEKYQASISQGGTNVSGGQKQRIAIARAICRNPSIYLFDDSFSALDYKTDRSLRLDLKKETAGVTKLIVAQRIGTIIDADQIIVLDEGKIVGQGKHKELLKKCEVYKEIAMSQLSEMELAI